MVRRRPLLTAWFCRHVWLGLFIACAASGCVSRRMTIHSNPPGALVLLDGKEIGYTPCSADFLYYGTREVTLAFGAPRLLAAGTDRKALAKETETEVRRMLVALNRGTPLPVVAE